MAWVDGTEPVLVVNVGGEFRAFQGICSHEYFELDRGFLTGGSLTCALHLSRFDLETGEALDPPAEPADRPLRGRRRGRPGPARGRGSARGQRGGVSAVVYLETERLVLRRLTIDDLDAIEALDGDPAVMRYITGGPATPREELRD